MNNKKLTTAERDALKMLMSIGITPGPWGLRCADGTLPGRVIIEEEGIDSSIIATVGDWGDAGFIKSCPEIIPRYEATLVAVEKERDQLIRRFEMVRHGV